MKPSLKLTAGAAALLWILLLTGSAGCKKNDTSPNNVRFSFNDSLQATAGAIFRPGYDFIGGANCEFEFDRTGQFATGETVDIGLFAGYHCDLMTSPLPYQTRFFSVTIIVNIHPWETISYSYRNGVPPDTLANTPGNLILTLTQRDNNRVRGTITGTIYRSNVGQNLIPSKFNCSFDLAIPLFK